MKTLFVFFIAVCTMQAQEIDYNTDKGVAAEGYDVVAYFNNQALKGNKTYTTQHDGVRYLFSTKENLNTFIKNPKNYIPQFGGYCAYAIAVKSKKVGINPEAFEIKDHKLYLFYNAWGTNTLQLWNEENPDLLLEKAKTNWKKIKYK